MIEKSKNKRSKKTLRTANFKLRTSSTSSRGGITTPLLLLAILFIGFTVFGSTLTNKSKVNTSQYYQPKNIQQASQLSTQTNSQDKNLQLKNIEFEPIVPTSTPQPTQAPKPTLTAGCYPDSGIPIDPTVCHCIDNVVQCAGGKAVSVNNQPPPANPPYDMYNVYCRTNGTIGDPNHTPRADGYYCVGKPVIYLYVNKPTFVNVTLSIPGKIVASIPEFEGLNSDDKSYGGWKNILALPGGVLKYQNEYYKELFYESSVKTITPPNDGIFLDSQNLKQELLIQTRKLGLIPNESSEFVDYWTPKLQALNTKYIFFSILSKEEKEKTDKVIISPKPDNFIEFIAYFKGVDETFQIKPFIYPKVPHRTGFTSVEWGGVIDKN